MKKSVPVSMLLALTCAFLVLSFFKLDVSAAELSGNDTHYATTDVNVRTGPGANYSKIGVLLRGESVACISTSQNGWCKVVFDGSEGYIRSRYLSTAAPSGQDAAPGQLLPTYEDTSVSFHRVDQAVYTTTTVNVRVGPGTQYAPLGRCELGVSIDRTGIGDNGWSRVIYDGEVAYICSKYLSEFPPDVTPAGRTGHNERVYARLTIPSVGIDVKLYYCSSDARYASLQQSIVDADNSAAFLEQIHSNGFIIADHNYQGFDALRFCEVGDTLAYIDYGTYTQTYVCTDVGLGQNTGKELLDWDKNSLNYGSIPGGLAMYTCNEDWKNVTITYWRED